MTEASRPSDVQGSPTARKRNLLILAGLVPVAALFALLGWAVAGSGGNPGGFGINSKFGQIPVDPRPAPQFVTETLDGVPLSLSELRGKVVMLDFWSSWCPPCRVEAPVLAQVYREYEGRNVEFVGIAIWDRPQKVADFVRDFDQPFPSVLDRQGKIAIEYGVTGIPEKFFIDTDGNLVWRSVGPVEPEDLRRTLDGLLAQ